MADRTFDDVLYKLRKEASSKSDLGARFEQIARDFFKTGKLCSNHYSKVGAIV